RSDRWFVLGNLRLVAGVLTLCALPDWDGMIAWHNVRHSRACGGDGVAVDLDYLSALGPASAPALRWYASHAEAGDRSDALRRAESLDRERAVLVADWRSWTWRLAAGDR